MLSTGADEQQEKQHASENAVVLKAGEEGGLAQEATGVVEEGEKEEEEIEGAHAGDGSSGPMDKGIQAEGGHGSSVQQQPQQEAAMPEGTKSLQAGDFQSHTRFTQSQLQDLEHLFEENHFPSFQVRKALARSMGVTKEDVQEWFRTRRAIFRRSNRMVVLIHAPPGPQNNDPSRFWSST
ncbi:paired box protein Pax-7-like isoform X2 [Peromyscus maniculatus bairdii]|uniref:paired box protein Pax-7-like isoform X2 n=1 Tax=Peromyscus maniculatus bairdii TaxID=230844 RepID=UPI003FD21056